MIAHLINPNPQMVLRYAPNGARRDVNVVVSQFQATATEITYTTPDGTTHTLDFASVKRWDVTQVRTLAVATNDPTKAGKEIHPARPLARTDFGLPA